MHRSHRALPTILKLEFVISAVLLRGLDALTTEDSILNCLMQTTNLPIKSLRVGRDSLTNTSRGICYVEMNSVVDAMFLHNQLLGEPPTIDDKLVSVSYYRPPLASASHQSYGGSGGNENSRLDIKNHKKYNKPKSFFFA